MSESQTPYTNLESFDLGEIESFLVPREIVSTRASKVHLVRIASVGLPMCGSGGEYREASREEVVELLDEHRVDICTAVGCFGVHHYDALKGQEAAHE